jgi:hypothetical protein
MISIKNIKPDFAVILVGNIIKWFSGFYITIGLCNPFFEGSVQFMTIVGGENDDCFFSNTQLFELISDNCQVVIQSFYHRSVSFLNICQLVLKNKFGMNVGYGYGAMRKLCGMIQKKRPVLVCPDKT